MAKNDEFSQFYSFESINEIPRKKRERTSIYRQILQSFMEDKREQVKLNWNADKNNASKETLQSSLRAARKQLGLEKDMVIIVTSHKEGTKRKVDEIFLKKST